ncbi:hypothetical protein D3C79_694020 [compost metagenome]
MAWRSVAAAHGAADVEMRDGDKPREGAGGYRHAAVCRRILLQHIHPARRQTFGRFDAPRHLVAEVFLGLLRKDLAQVGRADPPAFGATGLTLGADQTEQVGFTDAVNIHGRRSHYLAMC